MDPRHKHRLIIVQALFSSAFAGGKKPITTKDASAIVKDILLKHEEIDAFIQKYAPKFPLDQLSKVDLSILRLAIYELKLSKTQPEKVIIDEAIELAKELGNERSYAFINAVLGAIVNEKVQTII